jgi:hypothetical protein
MEQSSYDPKIISVASSVGFEESGALLLRKIQK